MTAQQVSSSIHAIYTCIPKYALQVINFIIAFPIFCASNRKPAAAKVYEDPQLQDNPAYGTASATATNEKGEEMYETCLQ